MAAEVEPGLAALLEQRKRGDRHVGITVLLRADLHPSQPWSNDGNRRFQRTVDDLIARVSDRADESPDWVFANPAKGGCELLAPVSFVLELLKDPDVARCLKGLVLDQLPDTEASRRPASEPPTASTSLELL